jgi:hypothetical protein
MLEEAGDEEGEKWKFDFSADRSKVLNGWSVTNTDQLRAYL